MPAPSPLTRAPVDDPFTAGVDDEPSPRKGRSPATRLARVLGVLLVVGGLGLLGYGAYQLWFTGVLTERAQNRLEDRFDERLADADSSILQPEDYADGLPGVIPAEDGAIIFDDPLVGFEDEDDVPVMLADAGAGRQFVAPAPDQLVEVPPDLGDALGRVRIPKLDLDWVVLEGVRAGDLRNGPGHIPGTAVPGQAGNAVISGHRTTNGAPFYELNELEPGDTIIVETVLGEHRYEVIDTRVVLPTDVWVIEQWEGAWLTLTTCNPRFSSRQRLIVFSKLVAGPNVDAINESFAEQYLPPQPPDEA